MRGAARAVLLGLGAAAVGCGAEVTGGLWTRVETNFDGACVKVTGVALPARSPFASLERQLVDGERSFGAALVPPAYATDGVRVAVSVREQRCDGMVVGQVSVDEVVPEAGARELAFTLQADDDDQDGYIDASSTGLPGTDCDDGDAAAHPGAPELCANGRDDNCAGGVDEAPCS